LCFKRRPFYSTTKQENLKAIARSGKVFLSKLSMYNDNMDPTSGLTTEQAEEKLNKIGRNEVAVKKSGIVGDLLHWVLSPITLMLLAAAALSFYNRQIFDSYLSYH